MLALVNGTLAAPFDLIFTRSLRQKEILANFSRMQPIARRLQVRLFPHFHPHARLCRCGCLDSLAESSVDKNLQAGLEGLPTNVFLGSRFLFPASMASLADEEIYKTDKVFALIGKYFASCFFLLITGLTM